MLWTKQIKDFITQLDTRVRYLTIAQVRALTVAPTTPIYITDKGCGGTFSYDSTDTTSADNTGTILVTTNGSRLKRQDISHGINVQWFGADPKATSDSSPAFQGAINFAKTQAAINGGTFRYHVFIPEGWYLLYSQLDCTNSNGLWIKGGEGQYINTGVIGITKTTTTGSDQGIIFDFTGSGLCGLENITVTSDPSWGSGASTIGVQFALGRDSAGNQTGGLRPQMRNVYFKMGDIPTANGGYGTVGYVNIRAEECSIRDCGIETNTPMIFSNQNSMTLAGVPACVFTSAFALINNVGIGSMTVIDISNVSLMSMQKRSPAMVLNGVSGLRYQGYIGRETRSAGTNQYCISFFQSCFNINIEALIESFQTALLFNANCEVINSKIRINMANMDLPATNVPPCNEIIQGAHIRELDLTFSFSNGEPEMVNRTFLYQAPVSGGDGATTCIILNSTICCDAWNNNSVFISPHLLNNSSNTQFTTGQPFQLKGNYLKLLSNYSVPIAAIPAGNGQIGGILIRFIRADKTTKTSNNGGFYSARIKGVISNVNDHNATGYASCIFESTLHYPQLANGTISGASAETMIMSNSSTNPSFISITDINVVMDFSSTTIGNIFIYINNSGTGVGQTLVFTGDIEITSNFAVNKIIPFF